MEDTNWVDNQGFILKEMVCPPLPTAHSAHCLVALDVCSEALGSYRETSGTEICRTGPVVEISCTVGSTSWGRPVAQIPG
jgi:hypothetical protein